MEERKQNFPTGSKINTLEESLKQFDKACLLEQLDMSLELIRRNEETKENHLLLLKSVDKELIKLSRTHHPDKAISEKKSDEEVTKAQNLQIALNATRTVLKALTEVFLKDIDVHYKYQFFANLDINTLINEKQIDLEINNVLCKISHLSEIKRVNIVGEIRKFLLESRKCLESFQNNNKYDFVRHRDNALHHLHKCIEGYKILATECELIVEECHDDNNENTRRVIQEMYEQSQRESEILQGLERVAKRSLDGNFEIYPIYEPKSYDPMKPVVSKEHKYLVSPFIFYVDVLLMCSVMVDKKTRGRKIISKIGETFDYWFGIYTEESNDFITEPRLLKAYHLASYFNNKNYYKKEVQLILKGKDPFSSESSNIQEAFKETVEGIAQFLAEEFDIKCYKEGKSNREQFNERLFELNDSMAEFKEEEKKLIEKFKLYEQETNEIQKEYFANSKKHEEKISCFNGDQLHTESLSGQLSQCTSSEHAGADQFQQNTKAKHPSSELISSNENVNQTAEMADDQCHDFLQVYEIQERKIQESKIQESNINCLWRKESEDVSD